MKTYKEGRSKIYFLKNVNIAHDMLDCGKGPYWVLKNKAKQNLLFGIR